MAPEATPRSGRPWGDVLRTPKKRWATGGIVAGLVWMGIPGCTDDRCLGSFVRLERAGQALGSSAWQSSPIEGRWVEFPHQRMIDFALGDQFQGRRPVAVVPFITADDQAPGGKVFTVAAGNLAVVHVYGPQGFSVRNDTCADYFVRVYAEFEPPASPSPTDDGGSPSDGGTDGDAGPPSDAGADADGGPADGNAP